MSSRRLSHRRSVAVACAATLVLAAAGCGSSSSSSSSTTTAASNSGPTATTSDAITKARVEAAGCMRSQGINIPDPTNNPGQILQILRTLGSYPSDKVQAAENACASSIRQAFPNLASSTPAQQALRRRQGILFAECMRQHGIAFPDPSALASDPSAYFRALGSLDTGSPAFKTATNTCRASVLGASGNG